MGSPASLSYELGRRLRDGGVATVPPARFVEMRSRAEVAAFEAAGGLDSTMSVADIYRHFARLFPTVLLDVERAREEELLLEHQTLRPVDRHAEELQVPARPPVLFLSDTYHDQEFVADQLRHHGLLGGQDRCFASSRHAASKTLGTMYPLVLADVGVPPETITHRGDDPQADYFSARRAGLQVRPFPHGRLNRYERRLDGHLLVTDGLAGRLAGASRGARLAMPAAGPHDEALRDVAAGVAAPLLIGFLTWAVRRAVSLGVRRMCFVARDGQVLADLCRRISAQLDLDLDVRYLHGSRQAWLLPTVDTTREGATDWLVQEADVHHLSVRILLSRLGLRCEEVGGSLAAAGWPAGTWDDAVPAGRRAEALSGLLRQDSVRELVDTRVAEQRRLLLRYLDQEGLLDGRPTALVDLATGGTLHQALATTLVGAGLPEPVSLILGIRRRALLPAAARVESWFPAEALETAPRLPDGLVPALEMFCLADHGTVLGYADVGGRAEPVLAPGGGQPAVEWGQPLVRRTVVAAAERLVLHPSDLEVDLRGTATDLFDRFWQHPTPAEVSAWGAAPLEDGWGEHSFPVQVARPYSWRETLSAVDPRSRRDRADRVWRHGSLRATHPVLRSVLTGAYGVRDAVRSR